MIKQIRDERGLTLMETIVSVVIVGIALPSLFVLIANLSYQTVSNSITNRAVSLANSRMEEIYAIRDENWDWFKDPGQFNEDVEFDSFRRVTAIQKVNNWVGAGIDAYRVTITVTQEKIPDGYVLTSLLTVYSR